MLKNVWRTLALFAVLVFGYMSSAGAGLVNLGAPTGATQAPNTWYVDRYAPSGWSYDEGTGVLTQTISAADRAAARQSGYGSTFYDTQGRKFDLAPGVTSLSIELFVSGDPLQQRLAGFWATAVDSSNQISFYPILEFAADAPGPRFQGWNGAGFSNYGLPSTFAYDAWHELGIVLDTTNDVFNYFLDGTLLGSVIADGSVEFANVMLQKYNKYPANVTEGDNSTDWRYLMAGPDNQVPEPSSFALVGVAGLSLLFVRRRKMVPVK